MYVEDEDKAVRKLIGLVERHVPDTLHLIVRMVTDALGHSPSPQFWHGTTRYLLEAIEVFGERPEIKGCSQPEALFISKLQVFLKQLGPLLENQKDSLMPSALRRWRQLNPLSSVDPQAGDIPEEFLKLLILSLASLPEFIGWEPPEEVFAKEQAERREADLEEKRLSVIQRVKAAERLMGLLDGTALGLSNSLETQIQNWKTWLAESGSSHVIDRRGGRTTDYAFLQAVLGIAQVLRESFPEQSYQIEPLSQNANGSMDRSIFEKAEELGSSRTTFKANPLRILANGAYLFGLSNPAFKELHLRKAEKRMSRKIENWVEAIQNLRINA